MNPILEAAQEICDFIHTEGWRCCIIGGLAIQHWGEARTTLDVNITVLSGIGMEEQYANALHARFEARIDSALEFAVANRVLLLRSSNGIDIDIALGALPFEEEMMDRLVNVEFAPGIHLPCCTAEDLFIMKMFSDRRKDRLDAESIVIRTASLDTGYIYRQLEQIFLIADSPDLLRQAEQLLGDSA
ncbi:MAG: hypothetical protein M5R41_12185 [Bacteroidia bacterium]|nr:hypothetical protein [Bacteroidia bacterium]